MNPLFIVASRDEVSTAYFLMISPFGEKVLRATAETAATRKVLEWGKPLLTFDSAENGSIIALGATPCGGEIPSLTQAAPTPCNRSEEDR